MRLDPRSSDYLKQVEEDAIAANTHGGKVDNNKAVKAFRERLAILERAGQTWAGSVLDEATETGLLARLKRRQKAMRILLRVSGTNRTMPRSYSQNGQLAFWMTMERAQLEELVAQLSDQAQVLGQNARVMRWALHLMSKHDAATAEDAFRAEGLDPVAVGGLSVPEEWAA